MTKINNWSLVWKYDPMYTAPELNWQCIQGEVQNHNYYLDGEKIRTSRPVGAKGKVVLTRSGSEYLLGPVCRKYAREFPGARKRLFASLAKIEGRES